MTNNCIGDANFKLYYNECKYKGLNIKRGYLRIREENASLYFNEFTKPTDIILYKHTDGSKFKAFVYDDTTNTWSDTTVTFNPFPWLIDKAKRILAFDNYDIPTIKSPLYTGDSFEDKDRVLYLNTKYPGIFVKVKLDEKPKIVLIQEHDYDYLFEQKTGACLALHTYNVELELYMLLLAEFNVKEN